MAAGEPGLLEALPRTTSRVRREESAATTATRSKASGGKSCKDGLSFGPKACGIRDLVCRTGREGSCKEQLSSVEGVHLSGFKCVSRRLRSSCKEQRFGDIGGRV